MAFEKTKLFYNNTLRDSQEGNDGTSYAVCAQAFADSDDPNKVRGDIRQAADVPNLAALEGSGIVFDATKNEYRIVDSEAAMRRVAALTMLPTGGLITGAVVVGSYLYCCHETVPGIVSKIDIATWSISELLLLNVDEVNLQAIAASSDGMFLFVGCLSSPGRVVKINVADFRRVDAITLASGENIVVALAVSGNFLYAGCLLSPGKVVRIAIDTWAIVGPTITFASGEDNVVALAVSGNFLYAGCLGFPGKVVRIAIDTWAIAGPTITFASFENDVRALAVSGNFLYAGCATSPGRVVRIAIDTWAIAGPTITFAAGENNLVALAVSGNFLYAGCNVSPGRVVKIDPISLLVLFSRLQSADIGGRFTVRAGLVCAEADPARPVDYAADGNHAPRFRGLLNTAVRIRSHAPNLIRDGGFESGAFSPNWTAGANWAIDATNDLEGTYSATWNTEANNNLVQAVTEKLIKGRTYRVIFKTRALTGNPAANVLLVQVKQAGSGTNIDGNVTGYAPTITTTAAWDGFDVVPDFDSDNWELRLVPALANKGGATAIIVDEIYVYEKRTVNSLVIGRHNWSGRGTITVNAWRLSPLRSTASVDANNRIGIGSFFINNADTVLQTLASSAYPVFEIVLPAVSGWTAEVGDLYLGDFWQVLKYPQPFDPYKTGEGKLRRISFSFKNLPPAYRKLQIEDLFNRLRDNEVVWVQHDADTPVMMEDATQAKEAGYTPYLVDLALDLEERL